MKQRIQYELTEEQMTALLDAIQPVAYIVIGGTPPPSLQDRANAAWQKLGDELGFEWETVLPVPGLNQRVISAVPK